MSEIRYDRMRDTHVIIAPERLHRPDFGTTIENESLSHACPFCAGNESMTPPEIFALRDPDTFANEAGWQTRVVPNLYKAVQIETPYKHHYGMNEYWEGFGAHEVIIDTPNHRTSMRNWNEKEFVDWMKTLGQRVADLRRDNRIAYLSLFKNEGRDAGATQAHSHTQLIGLPIIPKEEREGYVRNHEYFKSTGKSLLESILMQEEEANIRIVKSYGDFSAFCPYASAYPFEVMIGSKKALGQMDTLSDESVRQLAALLMATFKKLERQLGNFHFNLLIATAPLQQDTVGEEVYSHINESSRFSIRIMPRIYHHGGFEAGTGVIINPVSPELAAKLLRESRDV
ncbi:MAG: UDPglucose--hexose-phosphate uridylyltransferase [Campylobacterota bacterium]|nr:UDPglucose--hexose-phosphate uridylyltransferase [Campylobacterota bacterium]